MLIILRQLLLNRTRLTVKMNFSLLTLATCGIKPNSKLIYIYIISTTTIGVGTSGSSTSDIISYDIIIIHATSPVYSMTRHLVRDNSVMIRPPSRIFLLIIKLLQGLKKTPNENIRSIWKTLLCLSCAKY